MISDVKRLIWTAILIPSVLSVGALLSQNCYAQDKQSPPPHKKDINDLPIFSGDPDDPTTQAALAEHAEQLKRVGRLDLQGDAYFKKGMIDKAIASYKASHAIAMGSGYAISRPADIYFQQGRFPEASRVFTEWLYNKESKTWDGQGPDLAKAAVSLSRSGELDQAIAAFQPTRKRVNEEWRTGVQSPPFMVKFDDASPRTAFTPTHLEAAARTALSMSLVESANDEQLVFENLQEAIRLWPELPDAHLELVYYYKLHQLKSKTKAERTAFAAQADEEAQKAIRYGRPEIRDAARSIQKDPRFDH